MARRLVGGAGPEAAECLHLIDQLPDMGLVVADREMRYVMAGGPVLERSGWRAQELVGRTPRAAFPAGLARLVEHHMAAALRGESTVVPVLPATRGGVAWEGRFSPLREQSGEVSGVIFLLRDVSGHYRLGDGTRAPQDLFRSMIDVLPDAFGVFSAVRDAAGRVVDLRTEYVNPLGCALFGQPLEKLAGRSLLQFYPSLVPRGVFGELVHTVETGEPAQCHVPWLAESALSGAFEIRAAKLGDGIVGTLRDVTSQARAEAQLRASEERQRVTLDSAAAGVANVGLDGRFRQVNRRFCEITGYTMAEMRDLTFQDITHPEDLGADVRQAAQVAKGEIPWYAMDKRYIRKDGTVVWVLLTVAALRDELGEAYEYVATVTDITGEKQAQEEIARLNAGLEERVHQRTAELAAANQNLAAANRKLEAANQNLEAFTYTVSHDLRAPLTSLSGFTEMLAEEQGARLGEAGLEYLTRIQAASRRMDDLIDDLLALSAASRAEIRLSEVDLSAAARAAITALRAQNPGRRVQASAEDGVRVLGDARLLRTVLENLLGNAWKFTSRTDTPVITFATLPAEDAAATHCYVRDNGAGFDPADSDKLFRPFSRLHDARDFPGTGVGLASVQRIIERHHGRCWAEGQPGRGATFHFTLPRPS